MSSSSGSPPPFTDLGSSSARGGTGSGAAAGQATTAQSRKRSQKFKRSRSGWSVIFAQSSFGSAREGRRTMVDAEDDEPRAPACLVPGRATRPHALAPLSCARTTQAYVSAFLRSSPCHCSERFGPAHSSPVPVRRGSSCALVLPSSFSLACRKAKHKCDEQKPVCVRCRVADKDVGHIALCSLVRGRNSSPGPGPATRSVHLAGLGPSF